MSADTCNLYEFCNACTDEDTDRAQQIMERFELSPMNKLHFIEHALREACVAGKLKVVVWLHRTYKLYIKNFRSNNNYAARHACKNGHINVVTYLFEVVKLTSADFETGKNYALRWARQNKHTVVEEYLIGTVGVKFDRNAVLE